MVDRPGDAGGHLDPLEVAEHAEGLLESERATAVEAHLSSCTQCRELAASIAGVTTILAAAPDELPIPEGIAARIDATLAEEAGARSVPEPRKTRAEGFWTRLRGRMPAIAAAAASVAVLGLIGYAVTDAGGGDDAATTTDAGTGIAESDESTADAPMDAPDEGADPLQENAPAEEEMAEPGADDDAAGTQDDAEPDDSGDGGEAGPENYEGRVSPRERDALIDELQDVLSQQSRQAEPGEDGQACGTVLSEELGGELLGSTDTDILEPGSLLVAIDLGDPDTVSGWVLPECSAGPDDVMLDFVVPRPE